MTEKLDSKFRVEYDGWQKQEQMIHISADSNQQLDLVREAGLLRRGLFVSFLSVPYQMCN